MKSRRSLAPLGKPRAITTWNEVALLLACIATGSDSALAHGPHVHGTAELHVAVEGNSLAIEFRSPLANLLGFEHVPRTDTQRAAVKAMIATLNKPEALFRLPRPASCTAEATHIESALDTPPSAARAANSGHDEDEDEHADLTGTFGFTCARMAKLDSIEVLIFAAFPGTKTIKAEIIGPHGQSAATLSADHRRLKL